MDAPLKVYEFHVIRQQVLSPCQEALECKQIQHQVEDIVVVEKNRELVKVLNGCIQR